VTYELQPYDGRILRTRIPITEPGYLRTEYLDPNPTGAAEPAVTPGAAFLIAKPLSTKMRCHKRSRSNGQAGWAAVTWGRPANRPGHTQLDDLTMISVWRRARPGQSMH